MVKLNQINSGLTQNDWIKVCRKLGLEVRTDLGKGSHVRIYKNDGTSRMPLTIPCHVTKTISQHLYKSLLSLGFTEKEIDRVLK